MRVRAGARRGHRSVDSGGPEQRISLLVKWDDIETLEFNAAEQVVGIEMLNVSARSPDLNLNSLQFETT